MGRITSGIAANTQARQTLDFVFRQLPEWRSSLDSSSYSENVLNEKLCQFLNNIANDDFPMVHFHHEKTQGSHRKVDISVHLRTRDYKMMYEPIVLLECKRLPTPKGKGRELEYVTRGSRNRGGGIQRFKLGLYGNQHLLAGMIGYLQDGSISYWRSQINRWIVELANGIHEDCCTWNSRERLVARHFASANRCAVMRSSHPRAGFDEIHLLHLWVEL